MDSATLAGHDGKQDHEEIPWKHLIQVTTERNPCINFDKSKLQEQEKIPLKPHSMLNAQSMYQIKEIHVSNLTNLSNNLEKSMYPWKGHMDDRHTR